MLASCGIDFVAAALIERQRHGSLARKALLAASVCANLGLLGFFKYADFGARVAEKAASALGYKLQLPYVDFILPMGISFYTFQSMSYTIDVYRGLIRPLRSFPAFLFYVSFFPQLVAGPIVRADEFLPQMLRRRRPNWPAFSEGAWLIVTGCFLKMVCADNIAYVVDRNWDEAAAPGAGPFKAWALALLFSAQIFCGFAGYSNIARGLAYVLGFRIQWNFNTPYVASSFKNFWERWHISLSSWLRDYLYIPLGGNRISPVRTYLNLGATMLLGGLWHGASVNFVIWGAIHGAALALERFMGLHRPGRLGRVRALAWMIFVQIGILIAWVFFRTRTWKTAVLHVRAMFDFGRPSLPMPRELWAPLLFALPVVALHVHRSAVEKGVISPLGAAEKALLSGILVMLILTSYGRNTAFIYFQF